MANAERSFYPTYTASSERKKSFVFFFLFLFKRVCSRDSLAAPRSNYAWLHGLMVLWIGHASWQPLVGCQAMMAEQASLRTSCRLRTVAGRTLPPALDVPKTMTEASSKELGKWGQLRTSLSRCGSRLKSCCKKC